MIHWVYCILHLLSEEGLKPSVLNAAWLPQVQLWVILYSLGWYCTDKLCCSVLTGVLTTLPLKSIQITAI